MGGSKIIFATSFKVPTYLSDTMWDAHAKATEAILESYSAITNALSHLHSDVSEEDDTRLHANNFRQKNGKIGVCAYATFLDQSARSFPQG